MHLPASEAPSFYVNLHTANAEGALEFYKAIGLTQITNYSDDKTKAFRLPAPNDKICLMVHAVARFQEFMRPNTQINDATKTTESLFSITVEKKDDVDEWLAKATKAGGASDPYTLPGYGSECGMYTRSFADLDGHIWEVCTMIGDCGGEKKETS